MLLPFKSLLVFEAVIRNRSFTRAADELSVTQSAISHQIKNLEDYFSAKLIDRSGPSIALTADGEILYRDLSASMALLRRSVSNLKANLARTPVGISVRSHFALKWLSAKLREADFNFDFRFYHSNEPADFTNPDLHVSIEWLHLSEVPDNALLLVEGNLTPVCNPSLLEGVDEPITPALLQRFALLHENDVTSWHEWLQLAGAPDLQPKRNEFYSDTNVRQQAAIEKQGFALACPALIEDDLTQGRLVCPFEQQLNSYSYYLIAPQDRLNIPRVRDFVYWLTHASII
ncbi:MAG: LysR family transcriptional regulator [Pseudomonadales bacterium]